jgi:hypothetical protein
MPEKPNVMWTAKSDQYTRTQSMHLVVEIVESGLCFVLQTPPGTQPLATSPPHHPAQRA